MLVEHTSCTATDTQQNNTLATNNPTALAVEDCKAVKDAHVRDVQYMHYAQKECMQQASASYLLSSELFLLPLFWAECCQSCLISSTGSSSSGRCIMERKIAPHCTNSCLHSNNNIKFRLLASMPRKKDSDARLALQ